MKAMPRTSLWARLVVFYSTNKPDQLNSKVMAEIIAKYGSKERELSARLLKKYGRPLPLEVSPQEVREVLSEFSMQDEEAPTPADDNMLTANTPSQSSPGSVGRGVVGADGETVAGSGDDGGKGRAKEPHQKDPRAREEQARAAATEMSRMDFRSPFFDPLQALRDTTLKPPYPKEAPLDNVFKFFRLLPKSHVHDKPKQPSTAKMPPASASVAISKRGGDVNAAGTPPGRFILSKGGGGGAVILGDGWGRQSRPPDSSAKTAFPADARSVLQRMEVLTETSGKGTGEGMKTTESDAVAALVGHYGPGARSVLSTAEDVGKTDTLKAMGRHQRAVERRAISGGRASVANDNPVASIMDQYAGTGPYSLLHRLHNEKRRANVMIRRVNSVRGICTGLILGFDRHMNILLADVLEAYTATVPAKSGNRPPSPEKQPKTEILATLNSGKDSGEGSSEASRGQNRRGDGGGSDNAVSSALTSGSRGIGKGIEGSSSVRTAGITEPRRRERGVEGEEGGVETAEKTESMVKSNVGATSVDDEETRDGAAAGSRNPQTENAIERSDGAVGENSECMIRISGDADDAVSRCSARNITETNFSGGGTREENPASDRKVVVGVEMEGNSRAEAKHGSGDDGVDGKKKPRSKSRRTRRKGPWRGELVEVKRKRFLKQLLIRGDNIVMVWEAPNL